MEQAIKPILFPLLRGAVGGALLSPQEKALCTPELLPQLTAMAKRHDIGQLLAYGLERNGLLPEDRALSQALMQAVYQSERQTYALKQLCQALEEAQIPFIPLKGSVLRQYYPEPWMRTSVDIDILVSEENIDRATEYLVNRCGCVFAHKGGHDVMLWTKDRLCLELHYRLISDDFCKPYSEILNQVWQYAVPHPGYACWQELRDEMFYFYHIAHMAKHFEGGGCGIRSFLDLMILQSIPGADAEKRNALLQEGGLLQFANTARQLSRVWFAEEKHTELTAQMEQYILRGGTFGAMENAIAVRRQQQGSKAKYLLSRIFLPYSQLKFQFPCLQKHKWLTPLFQIVRWFRLLLPGRGKRAMYELKQSNRLTQSDTDRVESFLRSIGL